MWLFYFNFESSYGVLKSESPCIWFNKSINFNKNKTKSEMENPTHSFREMNLARTLCFNSCKNHKLKVKLPWVGVCKSKKRAFFVPFVLSEENFLKICDLSQCTVYWIHSQMIHTLTYQKTLFHTLLFLVFKIVESLECTLEKA